MYKKTAKSHARRMLKKHNYMPSLNTLSTKGAGSQWYKKSKTKKQKDSTNTLFGRDFTK